MHNIPQKMVINKLIIILPINHKNRKNVLSVIFVDKSKSIINMKAFFCFELSILNCVVEFNIIIDLMSRRTE